MSAVSIAPASPADVPLIAALEGRPENMAFVWGHSEAEHRERMDDPDVRYLRIEDRAGEFIGFALLTGLRDGARSARLLRIVVDAPGSGLGRPAMTAICGLVFGEWGMQRLWLDVFEDNARARHLYQSLGFRETGAERPGARRDGQTVPLIRMELWAREIPVGSPR